MYSWPNRPKTRTLRNGVMLCRVRFRIDWKSGNSTEIKMTVTPKQTLALKLVSTTTVWFAAWTMLKVCLREVMRLWYVVAEESNKNLTNWLYGQFLLEKLIVIQLVRKFPAFYGTRRFIAFFITVRLSSLSWGRWIQSATSHLRLGFPSVLSPLKFLTKFLYTF